MRTIEEQLSKLREIQKAGNIILIKLDGERESDQITVLIDFPRPSDRKLIQFNGDNLSELLEKLILKYEQDEL